MSVVSRASLVSRHTARRLTGQGRLPDFLILGAQKAGTTSLYNYLCQSPDVAPPLRKEVHYFSQFTLPPLSWYKAFFPDHAGRASVTGEATPFYLFHPDVPDRIEAAGLHAKFVAILRCPIERAWSHYRHEKRKGREQLGFADALRAEGERLRFTTDRVLDRAHLEALKRQSYLARGRYMAQISRFQKIAGAEGIHVLSLDQLQSDPATAVSQCCEYLGIAPPPSGIDYKVYNAGNEKSQMPEVDHQIFREAFDSDLEALATILPEADGWRRRLGP
ncbi:sulfotransferase family protein [Allopontixanthobacter sp.]|uniref:sulfotransferase family protein n=1 Tax=Allopontixanthobacter sp. TaxID=2906452 RepID=UPI002ABBB955|nr:sulfotransferase domain-containing protein [Allopontixanthobacter sp.]MDZ4307594.1 sulfotransferase domain-containing protein [Allopontixanthobacter sp.]